MTQDLLTVRQLHLILRHRVPLRETVPSLPTCLCLEQQQVFFFMPMLSRPAILNNTDANKARLNKN